MSLARKVAVNTSALTVGRVAFAISGVVGTATATRYLGPDRFGTLTIAMILASIFVTLGESGLYTVAAGELVRSPQDQRRLLSNVLGLGLLLSVGAIAAAVTTAWVLYHGQREGEVAELTAILVGQLLLSAPGGTAVTWLTARQQLMPLALGAFLSALGFVAALVVVVALDLHLSGVATAYAVGGALNAVIPVAWLWRHVAVRPGFDRAVWRRLARWAAPQAAVVILSVLYFRIDTFLLSFLTDNREVAIYGVAYKVIEFLTMLPLYFVATLFPEFARAEHQSEKLAGMTQAASSALQVGLVAILLVFVGFADDIVAVIAGPGFAGAASVLRILTIALLFSYFSTLFFNALIALRQQGRLSILLLLVLVVNVGLNLVLIPSLGAPGAALAVVISEILGLGLSMRLFRRAAALPRPHRPARTLVAAGAGAGIVVAVRAIAEAAHVPSLALLAVGPALAIATYLGMLYLLRAIPGELVTFVSPMMNRARRLRPGGASV